MPDRMIAAALGCSLLIVLGGWLVFGPEIRHRFRARRYGGWWM